MILLIKLFLAHLIGDFLLQPRKWVKEKEKKKLKAYQLYLHSLVHGLLTMILVWDWAFAGWAIVVTVGHLFIDATKLLLQKEKTKRGYFFLDQLTHLLSLYIIFCLYKNYTIINTSWFTESTFLLITSLVFLTIPSSYFTNMFIAKWAPQTEENENDSLQDAGKYIGILERLFAFAFVIMGKWEALGFLLAAKSII